MRDDRICTMKLAFRCVNLEMVIMDLRFEGNRLAVDISVANEHIRHLFEDEIYDFLYHFKKNQFVISSLNIHVDEDVIKSGESLGEATKELVAGDYVHVHNLDSKRGRGDWKE